MIEGLLHRYHKATRAGRVPGVVRWAARASRRALNPALRAAQEHEAVATPPYFQAGIRTGTDFDALRGKLGARADATPSETRACLAWIDAAQDGLRRAGAAPPLTPPASERLADLGALPARPTVSIVICTLNRAEHLARALDAIEELDYPDFELVIVNGPSHDGTDALLAKWSDRAKIVRFAEAHLGKARNVALAQAAGDLFAILDDDEVPPPHWLAALVRPYADPRIAAVGGYVFDGAGPNHHSRVNVCNRLGEPADFPDMASAAVHHMPGCARYVALGGNASFRRDLLVAIGGYDESFAFMLEDTDMCARVVDAGFEATVVADATVAHAMAPNRFRDAARAPLSVEVGAFSRAYFCAKHFRGPDLEKMFAALLRFRAAELEGLRTWQRRGRLDADKIAALTDELDLAIADGLGVGFSRVGEAPSRVDAAPPPAFLPFVPRHKVARAHI